MEPRLRAGHRLRPRGVLATAAVLLALVPIIVGVLAISLVFEGIWYLVHHGNAMTPAQTGPASGVPHSGDPK